MDTTQPSPAAQTIIDEDEDEDNGKLVKLALYYVFLLLRKWWILVIFGITGGAVGYIVASPIKPFYLAWGTVLIETTRSNIVNIEDVYEPNTGREFLATQQALFSTRVLAKKIIDRLDLVNHPEYDPRQQTEKETPFDKLLNDYIFSPLDSVLSSLFKKKKPVVLNDEQVEAATRTRLFKIIQENFTIRPQSGTYLVRIGFKANDPELAALMVNTMADLYVEIYVNKNLQQTKQASSFLSNRLNELRKNLQESEERLQSFLEQEQLVDIQGVRTLDENELAQLSTGLVGARQARINAEDLYRRTNGLIAKQLLNTPPILNDGVIQSLVANRASAERNINELSQNYGPKHPLMQVAVTELEEREKELDVRLSSLIESIEEDYRTALAREQAVEQQVDDVRSRLQNISRKEFTLRELEREVSANQQLYNLFFNRAKEADERAFLEDSPARIVDPATPPTEPSSSDKKKVFLMIAAGIGSVGAALILLLDFLKTSVLTKEEAEHRLGLPMIGNIPALSAMDPDKKNHAFMAFNGRDKATLLEAVKNIRNELVFSHFQKPSRSIMVASSTQGEGKSTFAFNLAAELGKIEKTLLLEADMRNPSSARALGSNPRLTGLSDVITGKATLKDSIHPIRNLNFDVLTSGSTPTDPVELVASKRCAAIINKLTSHYDRVIIDSAEINSAEESELMATKVDTVVYVVKAGKKVSRDASKGIKKLRNAKVKLMGLVLNQA